VPRYPKTGEVVEHITPTPTGEIREYVWLADASGIACLPNCPEIEGWIGSWESDPHGATTIAVRYFDEFGSVPDWLESLCLTIDATTPTKGTIYEAAGASRVRRRYVAGRPTFRVTASAGEYGIFRVMVRRDVGPGDEWR
jgi:hypothetical protein